MSRNWLTGGDGAPRPGHLLKVKERHWADVVITCRDISWASVHWCGRSVLCSGADCPLCPYGLVRHVGFITVLYGRSDLLLEVSESSARLLEAVVVDGAAELLLGARVRAKRAAKRAAMGFEWLGRVRLPDDVVVCQGAVVGRVCTLHGVPVHALEVQGGTAGESVRQRLSVFARQFVRT